MTRLLLAFAAPIGRFSSGRRRARGRRSEGLRRGSGVLVAALEGAASTQLSSDPKPIQRAPASLAGCSDMVSYYNSLAMFPHAGRPAPGPPAYSPYTHPSYTATSYQHDTNQNIQLAYAGSFGSADFGTHPPWNHSSWSSPFPTSCRSYEWAALEQGAPPPADAPATPPSDPALPSPTSPAYHRPDGSQSPAPSSDYHYKPALSPPQYKAEPSSTSDLVSSQVGPGDLSEDCPSPGSLTSSRPQPARSPYEWMKKPAYPSPPANHDPNARTRTKDKYRVVYSDHQRLELEKEFHYSRYITIRRKAELANGIGLSERQVKIWFQNRRAKERRSLKKQDDVMLKDKLDSPSLGAFSPPMGPMDHGFPPTSMGLGMAGLPHGLPQPHHFPQGLHGAQHFGLMKFE